MNCRTARKAMDRGENSSIRDHLAGCEDCRRLHNRLETARGSLRDRHAGVVPGPGFATAVQARLRHNPAQVLGLAALRVLPVTVLILMLLTWLAFSTSPAVNTETAAAPTDDVLAWVLEDGEDL